MNLEKYQFRKFDKSVIPKIPQYYNNIRFIDNDFWKEIKYIRDEKSKNPSIDWFKVSQIMKYIIGNQNENC